jgi:hypothetical protein
VQINPAVVIDLVVGDIKPPQPCFRRHARIEQRRRAVDRTSLQDVRCVRLDRAQRMIQRHVRSGRFGRDAFPLQNARGWFRSRLNDEATIAQWSFYGTSPAGASVCPHRRLGERNLH